MQPSRRQRRHAGRPSSTRCGPLVAACVLGVGLVTGTRGAPASDPLDTRADPRLETHLALGVQRRPLAEVLAGCAEKTGAPMVAVGPAADEPAVVCVREQPAAAVMRQIAEVFGFRWSRTGSKGRYRYELKQDLHGRQEEENLRAHDRERAIAAIEQGREAESTGARLRPPAALQVAKALKDREWRALENGATLHFSTLREPGALPLPPEWLPEFARVHPGLQADLDRGAGFRVSVWLDILWASRQVGATLRVRSAHVLPRNALSSTGASVVYLAGTHPLPSPEPPREEEVERWRADPVLGAAKPFGLDPAVVKPRRPGAALHLYDLLPHMAATYGINLIADAYWTQPAPPGLPTAAREMPLYAALNQYVLPVATWTRDGEFLHVRSRAWYIERMHEVPMRLVEAWAKRLRSEPRLALDEVAGLLLSLTDEQLPMFERVLRDERVHIKGSFFGEVGIGGRKEMLRAYATLPEPLRRRLRSGQKIALADLPRDVRALIRLAYDRKQRSFDVESAPLTGWPEGTLHLTVSGLERVVTSVGDEEVEVQYRYVDGVLAGQAARGEAFTRSPETVGRGLLDSGQRCEQASFLHEQSGSEYSGFEVFLPWVYVDREPAASPSATR